MPFVIYGGCAELCMSSQRLVRIASSNESTVASIWRKTEELLSQNFVGELSAAASAKMFEFPLFSANVHAPGNSDCNQ